MTARQRAVLVFVVGPLAAIVIAAALLLACGLPLDTAPHF